MLGRASAGLRQSVRGSAPHGRSRPPLLAVEFRLALSNTRSYSPVVDPDQIATPERTEQLRRSMAMLPPGQQSWLTRDDAMMILEALEQLQRWALGRACCHDDRSRGSQA